MRSAEIRKAFLEFFRGNGHEAVRSSSLVPAGDQTLLFTNAGMVQFKQVFLGRETRPYRRAASCQKCMRAGGKHSDIENVGYTARHHTFFEMLGNFSFGDYFKREAIGFAWNLLTKQFGLPADKLWATVYEEDEEAEGLWQEVAGLPGERIVRLGAKDNFWQMADTGPCGPCSEIVIDQGPGVGCGRPECRPGCDCDRYLELWNLVFMQYNRDESGALTPLPRPSIDTGMGLERIAAVLQGKLNNFDTDIFAGIIAGIEARSGRRYGELEAVNVPIRVIADHLRSIVFLITDGVMPSNEGRGYVLRRIIRRASRFARKLGMEGPALWGLADSVVASMSPVYPELLPEAQRTVKILRFEEERFSNTLEQGMRLLDETLAALKKEDKKTIPGGEVFKLYDTFGFPLDIVRDVAAEEDYTVDEEGFVREMQAQRERARASWVQEDGAAESIYRELAAELGPTVFMGYESLKAEAVVKAVIKNGHVTEEVGEGEEAEVILDKTPFYGESGGQVGDRGEMFADGTVVDVLDAGKPLEDFITHHVKVKKGRLKVWASVTAQVDEEFRKAAMRNHTATHLLHAALRAVLGEHVKQAGSLVEPERLRFDFTHFSGLSAREIEEVEEIVNRWIVEDFPVQTVQMSIEEALAEGATALFGEKYGERVRVVSVPSVSRELCGGTHARATGQIGLMLIVSEGSVASGIRRIEALTGTKAFEYVRAGRNELREMAQLLKTEKPLDKINELLERVKKFEKEAQKAKAASARGVVVELVDRARPVDGVKVLAEKLSGFKPNELRDLADGLRDRLGSGVIVLATAEGALLATVTRDLVDRIKAGDILGEVAVLAGGRGGGKPELAQGGTKELDKLDSALQKVYDIVVGRLSKKK
ncbi:MAG: alanine--tRNA ligase [Nitrospiraceae bacterium]|nr:alanine--tRNA ligase [Nitrospiraceae bacterium]